MSNVYFLKDFSKLESAFQKQIQGFYSKGEDVIVKLHFGEPGNKTAFTPQDLAPIIKVLKSENLKPILLDTPVNYSSPRDTAEGYRKVVIDRGYDKLADFVISEKYKKIKTKDFEAEVAEELINAKNVLVLTHVKGHPCSGFGGAIKNFGMGGVSKATKAVEHNLCKPKFVKECQGCGVCVKFCPAKAIKLVNKKAKISLNSCWGCSICELKCPHKVLAPQVAIFDDLLAQGASAVINNLPKKTYYINVVKNISKFCDCDSEGGDLISEDLGVLFSDNPVAIDKASVDLLKKLNKGEEVFEEVNHKDPLLQVKFASEYTSLNMDYELIEI